MDREDVTWWQVVLYAIGLICFVALVGGVAVGIAIAIGSLL
jgi:hypothetical protein